MGFPTNIVFLYKYFVLFVIYKVNIFIVIRKNILLGPKKIFCKSSVHLALCVLRK